MQWLIAIAAFILFWLLRAGYFYSKSQQTKKYLKIFNDYLADGGQNINISRHKPAIVSLFKQAGSKDFVVSKIRNAGYGYTQTYDLKGFDNIHLLDFDVASNIRTKFDETIGSFELKMKQSFNPLFWIESIVLLPQKLLNYVAPGSPNTLHKIIQVIYWAIMVLLGLHGVNLTDLSNYV